MEPIREVTTSTTPINPNLQPSLRLLAATPRWQRPDGARVSALLNEAFRDRDVNLLADAVQILTDKWDGAVDFWEFNSTSLRDECNKLRRRLKRAKSKLRNEEALVANLRAENDALRVEVEQCK
ncbi:hypothetical protein FQN50_001032 [Emmonsiellopsis sp. PD_5]|nr:hypothetical protein FQN50_001032 [Emmonsiellopsis sp. PD_5]